MTIKNKEVNKRTARTTTCSALTSLPLAVSRKPQAPAASRGLTPLSPGSTPDVSTAAAAAETKRTLSASAITTIGGEPPTPGHIWPVDSSPGLSLIPRACSLWRYTVGHGHSRRCPPAPHGVLQLRISWSPGRANRDLGSNDICMRVRVVADDKIDGRKDLEMHACLHVQRDTGA